MDIEKHSPRVFEYLHIGKNDHTGSGEISKKDIFLNFMS